MSVFTHKQNHILASVKYQCRKEPNL